MADTQDLGADEQSEFPVATDAVRKAAFVGDFVTVRRLVHEGAELNLIGRYGVTLLEQIVCDLLNQSSRPFQASDMVRLLIELGADPNLMGTDESVPLVPAMLAMDIPMLEALLEGGASPNPPGGVCDGSNLYDWAVLDYDMHVWESSQQSLLAGCGEADTDSEDAWLAVADRIALERGVRRPDHLLLLRKYGARSVEEGEGDNGGRAGSHCMVAKSPVPAQQIGLHDAVNYLSSILRDGCDWFDAELPIRLEAMHDLHGGDPAFVGLFDQVAHVYSGHVAAKAKEVLQSLGLDVSGR